MDARNLKVLRTKPRLDPSGLLQAQDQRNPDEFAKPMSDLADTIAEYVAAYPDGLTEFKPRHLAMARGHVQSLGPKVEMTLRQMQKSDPGERMDVCREVARRIAYNAHEHMDDEDEEKVVMWLFLATHAVV